MKLLVIGAGVIGQVYAGRLSAAGNAVTVLARGAVLTTLAERGIVLTTRGETSVHRVRTIERVDRSERYDAVVVAVRAEQLDAALEVAASVRAAAVATLVNLGDSVDRVLDRIGRDRAVPAFPGVGGERDVATGSIRYREIAQQPTIVGRNDGVETPLADALRGAGFSVELTDDMPAWQATHTVFIAGVGAAILAAGGESAALSRSRPRTAAMVAAIGEGFLALERGGVHPIPGPLRVIFTRVPRLISVPYWQRQLRGELGTVSIAPHVRATRDTEFVLLAAAARRLIGRSAPLMDALLADAGY